MTSPIGCAPMSAVEPHSGPLPSYSQAKAVCASRRSESRMAQELEEPCYAPTRIKRPLHAIPKNTCGAARSRVFPNPGRAPSHPSGPLPYGAQAPQEAKTVCPSQEPKSSPRKGPNSPTTPPKALHCMPPLSPSSLRGACKSWAGRASPQAYPGGRGFPTPARHSGHRVHCNQGKANKTDQSYRG